MLSCIMRNAPCPLQAVQGLVNPIICDPAAADGADVEASNLHISIPLITCLTGFRSPRPSPCPQPAAHKCRLTPANGWSAARACTAAVLGVVRSDPHAREDGSQQPSPRLVRLVLPLLLRPLGAFPGRASADASRQGVTDPMRRNVCAATASTMHSRNTQAEESPLLRARCASALYCPCSSQDAEEEYAAA